MQKIFPHIAYLLTKHECVIIPDFGAFMTQTIDFKCFRTDGVLIPGINLTGFNSDLKYNDGLLCSSIMEECKISYNEANIILQRFTCQLKTQLKDKGEIFIPLVGKLINTAENKIEFLPSHKLASNVSQYGFSNFYFPTLTEVVLIPSQQSPIIKDGDKNTAISLGKKLIISFSAAASIVGLLLLSTPIENQHAPTQYASVITSFITPIDIKSQHTDFHHSEIINENFIAYSPKQIVIDNNDHNNINTSNTDLPIEQAKATHLYYIIVGSFPSKNLANKILPEIQNNNFKNADILEKDGRFRIYVRQFENKVQAEAFLGEIRQNSKFKDAWLLKSTN